MTQTALSLILFSVPILLLTLEVGGLRDSVYSPSVLPEVFIYTYFVCVTISSSPFHFQQLEINYMAVLCIRCGKWLGNGEA